MGGGTDYSRSVPKARSFDVLRAVRDLQVGGTGAGDARLATAGEFCQQTHLVVFTLNPAAPPADSGVRVRLVDTGDGLAVHADSGVVGSVMDPQARALIGCLELGYELVGEILTTDIDAGTGRLVVQGRQTRAA